MTGTLTGTTQARTRSPKAYQRAFNGLSEKRKLELTRVVASMAQNQGKFAAQWWLEQQLDAYRSDQAHLSPILAGKGHSIPFPKEVSLRYAVATALALRASDAVVAQHVLGWLSQKAPGEFLQVATGIVVKTLQARGFNHYLELATAIADDKVIMKSFNHNTELAA